MEFIDENAGGLWNWPVRRHIRVGRGLWTTDFTSTP
jgi:hypothetical protein